MKKSIAALLTAAVLLFGLTAAEAQDTIATMCEPNQHVLVHNAHGKPFYVRNPYWRGDGQACIRLKGGVKYRVAKTPTDGHGSVVAFPDIMTGCIWSICTPGTPMPLRVDRIRRLYSTWHTRVPRPEHGFHNTAYDIWFGKHRWTKAGMATRDGAELMVWPDYYGFRVHDARKFRIDGRWWYETHWPHCDDKIGVCWRLIIFRAVHPRPNVNQLNLKRFIVRSEHLGLIRHWWKMESVGAGNEVWGGGAGLGTTRFNVMLRKTRAS